MPTKGFAGKAPVAIVGASGFIGRAIGARLAEDGFGVIAISRHPPQEIHPRIAYRQIASLADTDRLAHAMEGAGQLVHLADRANRQGYASDGSPPDNMRSVLAAMAQTSIPRLIYTSSVYARADLRSHTNVYGKSKAEAEEVALKGLVDTTVLRLAPVYGPGCGGGFAVLLKCIQRGLPLPLAYASAGRDYLAIGNLCRIISRLLAHQETLEPSVSQKIYELADGHPIGTADLAKLVGQAIGRPARLFPVPLAVLKTAAAMTGQTDRLIGAVDALLTRNPLRLPGLLGFSDLEQMPDTLTWLALDHCKPDRAAVTASP